MSILSKAIPGRIGRAQKTVIYGPEGFGKSTLASLFPSPLFFDVEGSTSQLDVLRLDRAALPDLKTFEVGLDEVAKSKPCATLVVDTADWLEAMALDAIIAEANSKKIQGVEDFGYGKGYTILKERFMVTLSKFDAAIRAGVHVVLLAHSKVTKFEPPDGAGPYDRYELKLSKHVAPLLKEWADALLFGNWRTQVRERDKGESGAQFKGVGGKERVMHCVRQAAWDAKNRHGLRDAEAWDIGVIEAAFRGVGAPWTALPVQQVGHGERVENLEAGPVATATTAEGNGKSDAAPTQQQTALSANEKPSASTAPADLPPAPDEILMTHDATGRPIASSTLNGDLPHPKTGTWKLDPAFVNVIAGRELGAEAYFREKKYITPQQSWRECPESVVKRVLSNPAGFAKLIDAQKEAK